MKPVYHITRFATKKAFLTSAISIRRECREDMRSTTPRNNYPAIMRAIAATNYDGYVGQEFSPRNSENWLASLQQAYDVCNV